MLYREINAPYDNQKIGTIFIQSNLSQIDSYISKQFFIGMTILCLVMIFSFILAIKIQSNISRPLNLLLNQTLNNHQIFDLEAIKGGGGNEIVCLENILQQAVTKLVESDQQNKVLAKEYQNLARNSEAAISYISKE